jgi:glycosyltransferase involved in cell wall biosynthesis
MKKLRIATYFENRMGRNDGAPLYYKVALESLGHEVIHFTSEDTGDLDRFGKFDLHLWVDWGEDGLDLPYKPMEKIPSPSVYIPCDTHITDAGRDYRFKRADGADWVFFNQKRGMDEYLALHPERKDRVFWLPCAVEPKAYPNKPVALKTYDVCFVGFVTFRKRAEMLDRMLREFPNHFYGQKFSRWIYGEPAGGLDTADIFRKSKIVFNTAAVDDFNMRVGEAMATGSFLLTEWVPHIDELFEDGKHLVTYKTMDEAVEKAHYYLEHETEREAIAKAGMEHTLANHTYEIRAKKLLSTIFPEKI